MEWSPAAVLELYQANWSTAFDELIAGKLDDRGRLLDSGRYRRKAHRLAEAQTIRQVGKPAWDRYRAALKRCSELPTDERGMPDTRAERRRLAAELAATEPGNAMDTSHMLLAPLRRRPD